MENCKRCPEKLVGRTELALHLCSGCISVTVEGHENAMKRVVTVEDEKKELQEKLGRYARLMSAEQEGIIAASRRMSDEDNPYDPETRPEENAVWLAGLAQGDNARGRAQLEGVVDWAVQSLETVREIALGNGQSEIAAKVLTVVEKLRNQIDG